MSDESDDASGGADGERFSYVSEVDVRFRDIDPMDHVNNALYVTYIEQARAEYYEDVIGLTLGEADTVLANLEVDYEQPIELGETVEVRMRVDDLGTSSIPMSYELRTGKGVVATAETVQVMFDRESGEPRPIPEEWRERIEANERGD